MGRCEFLTSSSPLNVTTFSYSSSHVEAQLSLRELFFSWWNLGTQGFALILEQNVSAPETMILGFNINFITAFLKRQLYSERWQSSTFLSLCCFSLLQRYLFHVSLRVYQSSLCCVLSGNHFYLFDRNAFLKNICKNSPHFITSKVKFHP